jgi:hypothetical protein
MARWQYTVSSWHPDVSWGDAGPGMAGLEAMLAHMGAEGWELVAALRQDTGHEYMVFKKEA